MEDVAVTGGNGAKVFDGKAFDTRSFIMSRAALQDTPVRSRLQLQETGDLIRPVVPRTVQARYTHTQTHTHTCLVIPMSTSSSLTSVRVVLSARRRRPAAPSSS